MSQADTPAGYAWGCFVCGKEIPEPQVYCSTACRDSDR